MPSEPRVKLHQVFKGQEPLTGFSVAAAAVFVALEGLMIMAVFRPWCWQHGGDGDGSGGAFHTNPKGPCSQTAYTWALM